MYTKDEKDRFIEEWKLGNEQGLGFAIGFEWSKPEIACKEAGFKHVEQIDDYGSVVANFKRYTIVVRDSHGPWAVNVTQIDKKLRSFKK